MSSADHVQLDHHLLPGGDRRRLRHQLDGAGGRQLPHAQRCGGTRRRLPGRAGEWAVTTVR